MNLTHDDGHRHGEGSAFVWAIVLNAVYVLIEAMFGFWVGSLALLADAAHNLTDVFGLLLAWGAIGLGRLRPNERHTYGFGRATILAALANGIILLIGVGMIIREAIERIGLPQEVPAATVVWVAGAGIVVNTASALLFMKGRGSDLNIRGAFLHMAADAAVSAAVVASALLMMISGWTVIDPIVAILVSLVIGWSAFGLSKSALHLTMEGVPASVSRPAVEAWLRGLPGVADLHDLHIWALSTTSNALTVHLVMPGGCPNDAFLDRAARDLDARFGIGHATLQVERGMQAECRLADVVRP
ncbi:MAG: cation transporter [Pseudorhodoplanes sp.]|nr:cation transporter [Pseudorhodoplanes sp.]